MKLEIIAGKKTLKISKSEWVEMSKIAESKKSPDQHGYMDQCIKENADKDNPGAYCASIVDKAKGTTDWRKGPKKD